jgi:hypothetical protein
LETQLGFLGFVLIAIALSTTQTLDHNTPLIHQLINLGGRQLFTIPDELPERTLRPLPAKLSALKE